jgi:antitoxin PrlF
MRMTSKGQVTIPEEIRHNFGLFPGCDIKFFVKNNKIYLEINNSKNRIASKFEKVKNIATTKLSTKQIMDLTRGD